MSLVHPLLLQTFVLFPITFLTIYFSSDSTSIHPFLSSPSFNQACPYHIRPNLQPHFHFHLTFYLLSSSLSPSPTLPILFIWLAASSSLFLSYLLPCLYLFPPSPSLSLFISLPFLVPCLSASVSLSLLRSLCPTANYNYKLDQLKIILKYSNKEPDMIGVIETWFNTSYTYSITKIDGYSQWRNDRESNIGEGIAVHV